ncbi:hypothetical protein IAT38_002957 [Cryptococcus sp. DSM 104549]
MKDETSEQARAPAGASTPLTYGISLDEDKDYAKVWSFVAYSGGDGGVWGPGVEGSEVQHNVSCLVKFIPGDETNMPKLLVTDGEPWLEEMDPNAKIGLWCDGEYQNDGVADRRGYV